MRWPRDRCTNKGGLDVLASEPSGSHGFKSHSRRHFQPHCDFREMADVATSVISGLLKQARSELIFPYGLADFQRSHNVSEPKLSRLKLYKDFFWENFTNPN